MRVVEDIFTIMSKTKKKISNKNLMSYYKYLSEIFWDGNYYIFHAYSIFNYFLILKQGKDEKEDIGLIADECILASVAVPKSHNITNYQKIDFDSCGFIGQEDDQSIKNDYLKLGQILTIEGTPSREGLHNEINMKNILTYGSEIAQRVYNLLEKEDQPLKIVKAAP